MENFHAYSSTKEIAQKLNVPVNTIYYWVAKGHIPYIKIGKHHRFLYQEVMDFFRMKTNEKIKKGV
jgi:excisionase family DNA binding protein